MIHTHSSPCSIYVPLCWLFSSQLLEFYISTHTPLNCFYLTPHFYPHCRVYSNPLQSYLALPRWAWLRLGEPHLYSLIWLSKKQANMYNYQILRWRENPLETIQKNLSPVCMAACKRRERESLHFHTRTHRQLLRLFPMSNTPIECGASGHVGFGRQRCAYFPVCGCGAHATISFIHSFLFSYSVTFTTVFQGVLCVWLCARVSVNWELPAFGNK